MRYKIRVNKINKTKVRFTKSGLVYILLLLIGLIQHSGIIKMYYLTAILTSVIIFILSFMQYAQQGEGDDLIIKHIIDTSKIVLFPWVIFIIYNFFIYVTGIAHTPFMKTSFIQITWTPLIMLGAFGAYYLFRQNTIRYFLYAVFMHYFIVLIVKLNQMGTEKFVKGVLSVFTSSNATNPFESNSDLLFALGILLVYYCDDFIKNKSTETTHAVVVLILIILGGKRIQILSLIAICLAVFATKLLSVKRRNIMERLISFIIMVALVCFVYLVVSGEFSTFVYSNGINAMGRTQMWDYVAQYVSFSPSYLGKGYAFSNLTLEHSKIWTYQGRTYTLHSDVLKMYFDLGFAMFIFWIYYNLFVLPKKTRKTFGVRTGSFVWLLSVYLFVLYLTDNCINYFAIQTIYILVILQRINHSDEHIEDI